MGILVNKSSYLDLRENWIKMDIQVLSNLQYKYNSVVYDSIKQVR